MKILVCGGRDYDKKYKVFKVLDLVAPETNFDLAIIEGGATGADQWAKEWADKEKVKVFEHQADWNKFGRAAGPMRNREMLEKHEIDFVLAFKGGAGTKNMVDQALKRGIIVLQVAE